MTSRGRRLYDWWSRHPLALRALYGVVFLGRERAIRDASVAALDLDAGDTVVELGCGRGNSFERLREAVGPSGRVIGVDYSAGMARAARERVARENDGHVDRSNRHAGRSDEHSWSNVHVVRADAARPPLPDGTADAAYAAMSLTAMPDATSVARAARALLRPGGRFGILDARPFQRGPLRVLNPIVVPLSEVATDWHPETDPVDALRAAFDRVTVHPSTGGAVVRAVGHVE